MSKFTYALVTALTLSSLTATALADACSSEKRVVEKRQKDVNILDGRMQQIDHDLRDLRTKISRLEEKISSAKQAYNFAINALAELRNTNENADALVASYEKEIESLEAELPAMKEKKDKLEKKYKAMSKWNPNRLITRLSYVKQSDRIKEQEKQIETEESKISYVEHVVENFDILEAQKITSLDLAERNLAEVRAENDNRIEELSKSEKKLERDERKLKEERRKEEKQLMRAEENLKQCLAAAESTTPSAPETEGEEEGEGRGTGRTDKKK